MKKWHLEGIIGITNTTRRKLVVPDSHHMYLWSTAFTQGPRREFFLVRVLRDLAGFFLRGF